MRRQALLRALVGLLGICGSSIGAGAQTWTRLDDDAPGAVALLLLLPDGTVMAADRPGGYGNAWYRLTPDASGSYQNGTWTNRTPMTDTRLWYASQVLRDGRVLIAGGEYGTGGSTAEVYTPTTDSWAMLPIPAGILVTGAFSDGTNKGFRDPMSDMLPDGRVLIAPVITVVSNQTMIFDPATDTFSAGPSSLRSQNEASWVKLADDSLLTIDKDTTQSERYIPATNTWINDANVPVSVFDAFGSELGAAFLLADGRAFFLGATGHTALYTPTGNTNPGTWAAGPDIPDGQGTPDAGAAMMINGKILCATSPTPTDADHFPTPTSFYEYDPVANSFTRVGSPTGGMTINMECYKALMLQLPNGQVLFSRFGADTYVYTPAGGPLAAGKPRIHNITDNGDGSFHLTGTLLNGISQGAGYGDDAQMNTNWPLVRLSSGGNVFYARTFNWSSTGVATGSRVTSTEFRMPAGLPPGNYSLVVVANGIASDPFACPQDIVVNADPGVCTASVAFSAGAPGSGATYAIGGQAISSPHVFPKGTSTVTATFPDNSTCSFNVTVLDAQPPSITCPANITRNNDPGVCGATVSFTPTVMDNCPGATIVCRMGAQVVTSPHLFPVGVTTVTCTATDGAGLTAQCSFDVQINDTEPPVVSAADAVVQLDEYGNATLTPATFGATATDNCLAPDCPVTLSLSQSVFLCPPVNVPIAVTVFGEDCHENVGSRVVNVTFPDPDCNMNGLADICDILSGRSQDCDHNRVPDECQCVWDGGDAPKNIDQVQAQISHVGGGAGSGAKVADDFYLCPGQMFRLFEFNGVMLTNLLPELRKARLELFADCDGRPAGEPIFTMQNTGVDVLAGPDAEGFYLVKYIFNLCDERLWLEGGRTYWWSMYGLGSCDGGNDLSSWVAATTPMMGSVPVKSDGLGGAIDPSCYPTLFGAWQALDECCIGCVNMSYKLVGQSCPIIWDNGSALLGLGAGGVLSENLSTSTKSRAADDFVVKPCADQVICLIDAWVWSNCVPVRGFIEIYEDDCGEPGALVWATANPTVIETGEVATIDGATRYGYILRFDEMAVTLTGGRSYWLSAGGDRTGAFNARTYFAVGGKCDQCGRQGRESQAYSPPAPSPWHAAGPDLAFRIASAPAPEAEMIIIGEPPAPRCAVDVNGSGDITVQDLFEFLATFFAGCP